LALAFLLLERLTPTERAAYVLREAFGYAFRDIAHVLGLGEANARQVVTRARQHIAIGRRRPTTSTEQTRLREAFIAAARHGDLSGLEDLFRSDVVSDLGRRRVGERCKQPVGRDPVAKLIAPAGGRSWSPAAPAAVDAKEQKRPAGVDVRAGA